MSSDVLLGVNIDNIATVRQARGTLYPDPIQAALVAEQAGADGITLHLREDRRHIVDRDVRRLRDMLTTHMNLEMAITEEMLQIASEVRPEHCCLVPEKREEVTTEGGLNVVENFTHTKQACQRLADDGIQVSLFIDPDNRQIDAAIECQAPVIELHTGCYADAQSEQQREEELARIINAANYASERGLIVNAGHGLHYHNAKAIAAIEVVNELNIGHAIIARALFSGLDNAVKDMKQLLIEARHGIN